MGWLFDIFGFESPSFFSFNCHCQGCSHIKANKVCQDFSGSYNTKQFAVAVISDGHGGDDYFRSDVGSHLAVKTALECIKEFLSAFVSENSIDETMLIEIRENFDKYLVQLETSIISRWRNSIGEHYAQNPFTEAELQIMSEKSRQKFEIEPENRFVKAYGATLIVAIVFKKHFWFGLQLGDGKCVALFKNGEVKHPIPVNEKCFLNRTTSLCDENPLAEFRHCFHSDNFPQWIFVGSDGIEDSFKGDEGLNDFYTEVARTFRKQNWEKAINELKDYLPQLSQRGSGDDMSISGIFNW
ncbi:MAG: protein phosphatase 2C domain-containing protein [Prevotellaceae bacterium]|nr:protein phosphatase 2C domain-containing protein [Prevotellaceae bacterium]